MAFSMILAAFDSNPSVSTDTRKIQPGDIYFALKGENFDGNKFVGKALEAGASKAVVDDPSVVIPGDKRFILVDDVLTALQGTAEKYRLRFHVPIIGITGTNGKTTTKELLAGVLTSEKKVHYTKGNLNNHIGVPLTLLSMPADIEVAIIEMGANKPGDIGELTDIALPTYGLITNIGRAHLEGFGGIDGVQKTKGELFDHLRVNHKLAWVNERDQRVKAVAEGLEKRVGYGAEESPYHIVELKTKANGTEVTIQMGAAGKNVIFHSHLIGSHNAENILAAVTVGDTLGISHPAMQEAIANYIPSMNRTQIVEQGGKTILLDAYNANPSSMEATLKSVLDQQASFGKIGLVLGDMFELGEESQQMHQDLVTLATELFPKALLIGIGEELKAAINTLQPKAALAYATTEEAMTQVGNDLRECNFVLIKGSRGMALERLVPQL